MLTLPARLDLPCPWGPCWRQGQKEASQHLCCLSQGPLGADSSFLICPARAAPRPHQSQTLEVCSPSTLVWTPWGPPRGLFIRERCHAELRQEARQKGAAISQHHGPSLAGGQNLAWAMGSQDLAGWQPHPLEGA